LSLIGNPVKIGDGPAAVTLPFSGCVWEKGTLLALMCHCSYMDGKAAEREGKSEDLSEQKASRSSRTEGAWLDLEDKNGTSPDRFTSVRDFFCPGPKKTLFGERR